MPLLIVPLAPTEAGALTLEEWDELRRCSKVFFESPGHPLMDRLRSEGVACGVFDDEPSAKAEDCALVADPTSERVIDLARAGARVTAGPAAAPDSLSAAHAASIARDAARSLATVAVVMSRLRSSDGCPWDQKQSHSSLEAHLLEESHEVIDAIERGDTGAGLQEELGDLLLQVAFHARIAQQEGRFDLAAVGDTLVAKLVRRHPHVFGDTSVADADEVLRNWEAIKRTETSQPAEFDDIPRSLPALLTAYKTQKRAAAGGFAPSREESAAKLRDALGAGSAGPQNKRAEQIGEALFWLVAVARSQGVDPETALLSATRRFRSEFARGVDPTRL